MLLSSCFADFLERDSGQQVLQIKNAKPKPWLNLLNFFRNFNVYLRVESCHMQLKSRFLCSRLSLIGEHSNVIVIGMCMCMCVTEIVRCAVAAPLIAQLWFLAYLKGQLL